MNKGIQELLGGNRWTASTEVMAVLSDVVSNHLVAIIGVTSMLVLIYEIFRNIKRKKISEDFILTTLFLMTLGLLILS